MNTSGRQPRMNKHEGQATTTTKRRAYTRYVREGVPTAEREFIHDAVRRNQLTGDGRFVDEVEQRMGLRIETRHGEDPKNKSGTFFVLNGRYRDLCGFSNALFIHEILFRRQRYQLVAATPHQDFQATVVQVHELVGLVIHGEGD